MRIFKMVFGGLLTILILGIMGWLVREKLVLAISGYKLRNDIAELRQIAFRDSVSGKCNGDVNGYQLRFTSESEYVIEPVCGTEQSVEPISVGRLAYGVRRLYGSGILIELVNNIPITDDAWVHLAYGESRIAVGIFEGLPRLMWKIDDLEIGGKSPAWGACSDWGFSCCVVGVEKGEGAQVRTYDCTNNCYQKCNRLPVVMLFNSEPVVNQKTRTVVLSKSDAVIKFGLEISDDQGLNTVEVDFGDGQKSPQLSAKTSDLPHEYQCNQTECRFFVSVSAKDEAGNELVDSILNNMMVIVR